MPARRRVLLAGLGLLLATVACRVGSEEPASSAAPDDRPRGSESEAGAANTPDAPDIAIYVASNGWHSAIIVPRAALPPGLLPEAEDFPDASYLSFGWGDAAYFPARDPTTAMALTAALRPTPAVVHLASLPGHPRRVFPNDEVVELRATSERFAALAAYLDAAFERGDGLRAQASAPGLHRFSLFYPATGEFHLFNTCNTWTAGGLRHAGWSVRATGVVTAEELMSQLRPLSADKD